MNERERLVGFWFCSSADRYIPGVMEYQQPQVYPNEELTLAIEEGRLQGTYIIRYFDQSGQHFEHKAEADELYVRTDVLCLRYRIVEPVYVDHIAIMLLDILPNGREMRGIFATRKINEKSLGMGLVALSRSGPPKWRPLDRLAESISNSDSIERPESQPVFISYATADKDAARTVRGCLRDAGLGAWMAEYDEQAAGSGFWDQIESAIHRCQVVVLVLSRAALKSKWVFRELAAATLLKKGIIVLQIENFEGAGVIWNSLRERHILNGCGDGLFDACSKAAREVSDLLLASNSD